MPSPTYQYIHIGHLCNPYVTALSLSGPSSLVDNCGSLVRWLTIVKALAVERIPQVIFFPLSIGQSQTWAIVKGVTSSYVRHAMVVHVGCIHSMLDP